MPALAYITPFITIIAKTAQPKGHQDTAKRHAKHLHIGATMMQTVGKEP
jgi:hypothetical protein